MISFITFDITFAGAATTAITILQYILINNGIDTILLLTDSEDKENGTTATTTSIWYNDYVYNKDKVINKVKIITFILIAKIIMITTIIIKITKDFNNNN